MLARAIVSALFGFSAIPVGAATAWSMGLLASIALAVASGAPPEQQNLMLVFAILGVLVALVAAAWLYVFVVWAKQLQRLRALTFLVILGPFLFGFVAFGRGLLPVIAQ